MTKFVNTNKFTTESDIKALSTELLNQSSIASIVDMLAQQLAAARHRMLDNARNIRTQYPELYEQFKTAGYDLLPEGKPEDWQWSKSLTNRLKDKEITTVRVIQCLEALETNTDEHQDTIVRLRDTAKQAELAVGLLKVLFPIYVRNVKPLPITHYDYNPNASLIGQKLPGYIWKRLAARNVTPTTLNAMDVHNARPTAWYVLHKKNDGMYSLKSTGYYVERYGKQAIA